MDKIYTRFPQRTKSVLKGGARILLVLVVLGMIIAFVRGGQRDDIRSRLGNTESCIGAYPAANYPDRWLLDLYREYYNPLDASRKFVKEGYFFYVDLFFVSTLFCEKE